jgi:hypothetical protein
LREVRLLEPLARIKPNWQSVTVLPDGKVIMKFKDGSKRIIKPPKPAK